MLTFLNISNFALIDDLRIDFEHGLNLLTGETGSGKSIIVDALGVLIGGRFTADLLKSGEQSASVEGLFSAPRTPQLEQKLGEAGIEADEGKAVEIVIRRETSTSGRNKIFINHQLATQSLLRELRPFLVDIHGQGDQQTLFDRETHLEMLDAYAGAGALRRQIATDYRKFVVLREELDSLRRDEAEKLQLMDILRFQIDELERAELAVGEDERLEEERRRMMNVEKLTKLCGESFDAIYEDSDSAIARIGQAARRVEEIGEFDSSFRSYLEGLASSRVLLEDLALALRDFAAALEFQPGRLAEIDARLVDVARLKRKYGGSIEGALEHLARSQDRLRHIEQSDEREMELMSELRGAREVYLDAARKLHRERVRAAKKFEQAVERDLAQVAMEGARFQVHIVSPPESDLNDEIESGSFAESGIDRIEFLFSANVGESVKPLAKVASGGEASRLMLVLKTVAASSEFPRTIVFDEIDSGIGGRASEAVGAKLKKLSETNQVLCVTHQPQIARFAEAHLLVRKDAVSGRTQVTIDRLDRRGRVEELARMLTGAEITESARRHARELLKV
jgi:DNA repair protein RecN (Recombination protein N)